MSTSRADCLRIGRLIRYRRQELDLSQKQLGEKMGYSATFISAYEKGQCRTVHPCKLKQFAQTLNVPMDYFQDVRRIEVTSEEQRLLREYRLLDPKHQQAVIDLIRSLH